MEDKYYLVRFIKEQEQSYSVAFKELSHGRKQSHWMWWIFPQIAGLGMTSTSQYYSIQSLDEARAFLEHPYLGKNLRDISKVLLALETNDADYVMGYPDNLKLCSSMTLFSEADPTEKSFRRCWINSIAERRMTVLLEYVEKKKKSKQKNKYLFFFDMLY